MVNTCIGLNIKRDMGSLCLFLVRKVLWSLWDDSFRYGVSFRLTFSLGLAGWRRILVCFLSLSFTVLVNELKYFSSTVLASFKRSVTLDTLDFGFAFALGFSSSSESSKSCSTRVINTQPVTRTFASFRHSMRSSTFFFILSLPWSLSLSAWPWTWVSRPKARQNRPDSANDKE